MPARTNRWLPGLIAMLWLATAAAQSWPEKPITLVVGTPPAGAVDAYARTIGEHMAHTLGQKVLVENKPGANGNISAEYVYREPSDGYTVWVGTQPMVEINPSVFSSLRWKFGDYTGLMKGVEAPLVFVVHPGLGVKTMAELAAWLKSHPDKASFASFSPVTSSHFLGIQLGEKFGVKMTHIPYKGSAPQTQDLVGGHVPMGFSQLQTTMAHIKAGKLVALATTGKTRWHQLPDVPTLAELGYRDMDTTVWFGLFVRKDVPAAVRAKIQDAAKRAHADPAVRGRLEGMGFQVPAQTDPEFTEGIRAAQKRWAAIVKATGFKAAN